MRTTNLAYKLLLSFIIFFSLGTESYAQMPARPAMPVEEEEALEINKDSVPDLPYDFNEDQEGSLALSSNKEEEVIYDPSIGKYVLREKIGNYYVSTPIYMTPEQYLEYRHKKDVEESYKNKIKVLEGKTEESKEEQRDLLPTYYINSQFFETVFGSNEIDINPTGNVQLKLGVLFQKVDNPLISEKNRRNTTFDFDQQITASINAKVGTRLNVYANYDTQSTFDFQNQVKLEYTPNEDDILQKIEIGNVSMPIKNSLISGAQNLFGLRTEMQFGKTRVSAVIAEQKSQAKKVNAEGGSSITEFELLATDYDEYRHFFLSQAFRNNYDNALRDFPLVNSQINIIKLEVWVTNRQASTTDFRNIVAIADLGELDPGNYGPGNVQPSPGLQVDPSNEANDLSNILTDNDPVRSISTVATSLSPYGIVQGEGYSILENARKLEPREYTFHPQLGYVSLNRRLAEADVLAVAYEYTISGSDQVYKVGELTTDGVLAPKNLVTKLLKSEIINTDIPLWDMMMKNIYALGAYDMTQEGLRFELLYLDDETGVKTNVFQKAQSPNAQDRTLLNIFNLDQLDQNSNAFPKGDGYFDYVEGITVNSQNGYVIFPVVEPFGEHLQPIMTDPDDEVYIFDELYETTRSIAKNNYQTKNKYYLKGYTKSSGTSGIALGAYNIPKGSVHVTSGGRELVEGVDYVVDYQIGRVQIINPAIESSNAPIEVSVENNSVFNLQNRRFMGLDIEHQFSEKFVVGATVLDLRERPVTQKANLGSEPIRNTIFGLRTDYGTQVPFFTKLVNKIPTVDTDAESNFSVRGDFAYLRPSSPKQIDLNGQATSYIDDFEGAQTPLELKSAQSWFLSSAPQGYGGELGDVAPTIDYGKKRARLAWYAIDQLFYGSSSLKPGNIDAEELSRAETRRVRYQELFDRDLDITQASVIRTLDLAYYPHERGSYNYDTNNVDGEGKFTDPEDRFGGITRPMSVTNFEQANIEYIQFWMQDPYTHYSITEEEGLPQGMNPNDIINQVGTLYFNLGNISEDILKDNRKMYENGLPESGGTNNTDATVWGKVPNTQSLLYAFSTNDSERLNQDIGLDGMNDSEELAKFGTGFGPDPSSDNYEYFRSSNYDANRASIVQRYKRFNNTQGNSPTSSSSPESYPTAATNNPDVEDIDRDQTMMNVPESYYEYEVSMSASDLVLGQNYIVDEKNVKVDLEDGSQKTFRWLQFRIPVNTPDNVINNMEGFNSIRFMRMFMTDFRMPVVLRFAELQLVRGDWRRYNKVIDESNTPTPPDLTEQEQKDMVVGVVNYEQNRTREPIPYVLPPGVQRERLQGATKIQSQNEQSLSVKLTDLPPGETRAVYKNVVNDLRMYKNLKMFVHAEPVQGQGTLDDDELQGIIRLGSDLNENYYEIAMPLKVTQFGATTAEVIWPNDFDVVLKALTELKLDRYEDPNFDSNELYPAYGSGPNFGGDYEIRVKGNPNLGNIKTLMLGVKNVTTTNKSTEVWFNELRTADFDNDGGWAAYVTADANFADIADISVTGGIETIGFGGLEETLNERSQEDKKLYDFVSNINVGKLMPQSWGMNIPLSYSIAEEFRDPKYDMQYQDVLFSETTDQNSPNRDASQDHTKRTSISLINVKKDRVNTEKKARFYDVENLSVSYVHNERTRENYNIKQDIEQDMRASASYNYNFQPLSIEPFKNAEFAKSKYLRLISDLNFNFLPSTVSINGNISRSLKEQTARTLVSGLPELPTLRQNNFMFDWDYMIGYNLTKSLQFNFRALNNYVQDIEPSEEVSLYDNFFDVGRPQHYHQTLNLTYQIPIDKVPFLEFIRSDYSFTADYDWQAASQSYVDKIGNTIQNANTHNFSADADLERFYDNIGITEWFTKRTIPGKEKRTGEKDENGEPIFEMTPDKYKKGNKGGKFVVDLLTMVKKVRVNYSERNGTLLGGFIPTTGFLGQDAYRGSSAPTFGFVFGDQRDIRNTALQNGWLISRNINYTDGVTADDPYYNRNFNTTHSNQFDVFVDISPFRDFDIELNGKRIYSENYIQQSDVVNDLTTGETRFSDNPVTISGNFSTSFNMVATSFSDSDQLFETFKSNRDIIAQRLADETGADIAGFGRTSQQVMVPAFVAAYSGKSAGSVKTEAFIKVPRPNWTATYKGLMRIKWFKKNFQSFSLSHGYQSLYSITNYTNNLLYDPNDPYGTTDLSGNYYNEQLYGSVNVMEAYSPLIKVDLKTRGALSLKAEVRKDRMLNLNFNNNTLTEVEGQEYIVGAGYRFKKVKLRFKFNNKNQTINGDLNLRLDFGIRDNLTLVRDVDVDNSQITGGQRIFTLKFLADYAFSRSLTMSFYYDHNTAKYAVSTSFPRTAFNTGLMLQYNLGN